eukprot:TRINITY_DN32592_c0_g1_i1.p1 TRINITY_DN32592_c0_g1~~TRINITY_DN32592_c0_g1_i1.p1  ORF type:complete len:280 (+),score=48.94 TRINITY_DN32592_c0_g1_i1:42-842(+)
MAPNRSFCPVILHESQSFASNCSLDEACVCANSSLVRELVNVTLDGLACYACEVPRPPACTEAYDQCTPEACECANPLTHKKFEATTVDGSRCHYCEPINGPGFRLGGNEIAMGALAILATTVIWQLWSKKSTGGRGSLRLSRRQGDRSKAIRVQEEPLRFYEEVLFALGDTFDMLVDGVCELLGYGWSLVRAVLSALGSAGAWVLDSLDHAAGSSWACVQSTAAYLCCRRSKVEDDAQIRSRGKTQASAARGTPARKTCSSNSSS